MQVGATTMPIFVVLDVESHMRLVVASQELLWQRGDPGSGAQKELGGSSVGAASEFGGNLVGARSGVEAGWSLAVALRGAQTTWRLVSGSPGLLAVEPRRIATALCGPKLNLGGGLTWSQGAWRELLGRSGPVLGVLTRSGRPSSVAKPCPTRASMAAWAVSTSRLTARVSIR